MREPGPPRVWVLNLDAEHELEAGPRYRPTRRLQAIVARERLRLIDPAAPRDVPAPPPPPPTPGRLVGGRNGYALSGRSGSSSAASSARRDPAFPSRGGPAGSAGDPLVGPHDLVVGEEDDPRDVRARVDVLGERLGVAALEGLAWSPTPRASRLLERAGATPVLAADAAVLAAVNARPFAAAVREPLAEASFVKHVAPDLDTALARLARRAEAPDGWLVRRTFGAAGRGRRRIAAGRPSDAERAWLVASLRRGPLVLEPWVRVTRELTRSGWVGADGRVAMSAPCLQETTSSGAWTRSEPGGRGDVLPDDDARLARAFEVAGQALARAGYIGPFGIDAFRHRVPGAGGGAGEVLNPLSEINARFTMDWTSGMEREAALAAVAGLARTASAAIPAGTGRACRRPAGRGTL